jgi:hypothetical protein
MGNAIPCPCCGEPLISPSVAAPPQWRDYLKADDRWCSACNSAVFEVELVHGLLLGGCPTHRASQSLSAEVG